MHIGFMPTAWEHPRDLVEVAVLAEARELESVWLGEHTHTPVTTEHRFAKETPEFYRRIVDPYVTLAGIAAATSTIRLGTGIALPAQGDALTLAKTTATLDQLSSGRFEWGVGYGWNEIEMRNHGLDPGRRMATFGETIAAVRRVWTEEEAGFDGKYVSFTPSWSFPKPAQRPHPPMLLGCRRSPRAFAQLVEHCDGWLPSVEQCLEGADESIADLRQRFADAGRDPTSLRLTFIDSAGFWKDVSVDQFRERRRIGAGVVRRVRDLGADRLIVGMPLYRMDDVEPMLDAVAELIDIAA